MIMIKRFIRYITHWEDWHWFAKYVLIAPAWVWLCLKARSFWFFSTSNPGITFSGFVGETKREIYERLPSNTYPKSVYISPDCSIDEVVSKLAVSGLSFPLAAKPDAGMMGFMFRKIESLSQLEQYHAAIRADYIIQEYVTYPLEVSVFYYRFPEEVKGHITGFVRKDYMEVIGDGERTLHHLISDYPRAQFRLKELFAKHESNLNKVIPRGEIYCLSQALNLSRGGKLVSLEHEKDDRLLKVFDDLSHLTDGLYFGRYDIRCNSIRELKEGRKFLILEYNGSGAEPHHVYGNGNSLLQACRILVAHWNILYHISMTNYRKGIPRWSFMDGWRFTRKARAHFRKLREVDRTFEFKTGNAVPLTNKVTSAAMGDYMLTSNA
jgi:hypothetical protein